MSTPLPDRFAELQAPAHWQAVDFISDVHLQAGEPETASAWHRYLNKAPGARADALFILGDLFEVWVGDDLLSEGDAFAARCAATLHAYSEHTPVFFLCGNRDFLLGPEALSSCGMQGLADPTVLTFNHRRWLLSHGDALCLADHEYQRFRAHVRTTAWQASFLAQPLSERKSIARGLRQASEKRKHSLAHDPALWADVDAQAARHWLAQADAAALIHGHTHRPAEHDLGQGMRRVVLSDWEANASPPRLEVLRLDGAGLRRIPLELG